MLDGGGREEEEEGAKLAPPPEEEPKLRREALVPEHLPLDATVVLMLLDIPRFLKLLLLLLLYSPKTPCFTDCEISLPRNLSRVLLWNEAV